MVSKRRLLVKQAANDWSGIIEQGQKMKKVDNVLIKSVNIDEVVFHKQTIKPTLINYFFGKNGSGKSTVAKVLSQQCSDPEYDVYLFNEEFIRKNVSPLNKMDGVFTLSGNGEKKEELKEKKKRLKDLSDEYTKKNSELMALRKDHSDYKSKTEKSIYSLGFKILEPYPEVMKGLKTKKEEFVKKIINTKPAANNLDELGKQYKLLYGSELKIYRKYEELYLTPFSEADMDLLVNPILSSANTQFANFVKKIGALDWVKAGHERYHTTADGLCPYCQQKLPMTIEKDIASCFDEAYTESIQKVNRLLQRLNNEKSRINASVSRNDTISFISKEVEELHIKSEYLVSHLDIVGMRIVEKLKEPSQSISVDDMSALLKEINGLIQKINKDVDANNSAVNARDYEGCKNGFWAYLAHEYQLQIKDFLTTIKTFEDKEKTLSDELEKLKTEGWAVRNEINTLNKSIINTTEAKDKINEYLKRSGFMGFQLVELSGESGAYQIIRDGETKPAEHLSEGERNYIAFLYFYQSVMGNRDDSGNEKKKIVIIDDPVSSMDSGTLYMVSTMVRNLIRICYNRYAETTDDRQFINQIFILTHNPYFFREVSYDFIREYECVNVYTIQKHPDRTSTLEVNERTVFADEKENMSPVRSTYEDLWYEVKTSKDVVTLTRVMRQILDHYFLQISGNRNVRDKLLGEESEIKFANPEDIEVANGLLPIFNSTNGNLDDGLFYDAGAFSEEVLRRVFRDIFKIMGQDQHYEMMMGKTNENQL